MKSLKLIAEKKSKESIDACWKGYTAVGFKKKNGKRVPNCVPDKDGKLKEDEVSKEVKEAFKYLGEEILEDLNENNPFRLGSENYFEVFNYARYLNTNDMSSKSKFFIESDIGTFGIYEGKEVPLDCPMEELSEEKDEPLNKPKRGGAKKFYVYVKNKLGNVIKVTFGDPGMSVKFDDEEARKSFAARHQCSQKKDKTKAGYWSCNLPRYAKQLGLSGGGNFFW